MKIQALTGAGVKDSLAAIPVPRKHHALAFAHVQLTQTVQLGVDREFTPIELTALRR